MIECENIMKTNRRKKPHIHPRRDQHDRIYDVNITT